MDQARKLRELGIVQESLSYYQVYPNGSFTIKTFFPPEKINKEFWDEQGYKLYSAFDIIELAELMPPRSSWEKGHKAFTCKYWWGNFNDHILRNVKENSWHQTRDEFLSRAIAAMLIYIMENKLNC